MADIDGIDIVVVLHVVCITTDSLNRQCVADGVGDAGIEFTMIEHLFGQSIGVLNMQGDLFSDLMEGFMGGIQRHLLAKVVLQPKKRCGNKPNDDEKVGQNIGTNRDFMEHAQPLFFVWSIGKLALCVKGK